MILESGIPSLAQLDEHLAGELFRRMLSYDSDFVARHGREICGAATRWASQPMLQWSRRWEYPYVFQRLEEFARNQAEPLKVLDAGSGVTFFPYYLCGQMPGTRVTCCDGNAKYASSFARLAEATGNRDVTFTPCLLQNLPLESHSLDAIYCISVLEHTGRYGSILEEFRRVLRPGGLLVLTFDISLDGRTQIDRDETGRLLGEVLARFEANPPLVYEKELLKLQRPAGLLTTDAVKAAHPELLPWKWPRLKSLYDFLHGRGWSGGFFSLTVYCCSVTVPCP